MEKRSNREAEAERVTLTRRLQALAAFLPTFESPDFQFSEREKPKRADDGYLTVPIPKLTPVAREFIHICYKMDWIRLFSWETWYASPEAVALKDNPTALAQASPAQLSRLLTALIRRDRHGEASLVLAFKSGLLVKILKRMAVLAAHPPECDDSLTVGQPVKDETGIGRG